MSAKRSTMIDWDLAVSAAASSAEIVGPGPDILVAAETARSQSIIVERFADMARPYAVGEGGGSGSAEGSGCSATAHEQPARAALISSSRARASRVFGIRTRSAIATKLS